MKAAVVAGGVGFVAALVTGIIVIVVSGGSGEPRSGGLAAGPTAAADPSAKTASSPAHVASGAPAVSPVQNSAGPPPSDYQLAYRNKTLIIHAAPAHSCDLGQYADVDALKVNAGYQANDDVKLFCTATTYSIGPENSSLVSMRGRDDPDACAYAINSSPINPSAHIKSGEALCIESGTGLVAYARIVGIDSGGSVTLKLDGWTPR